MSKISNSSSPVENGSFYIYKLLFKDDFVESDVKTGTSGFDRSVKISYLKSTALIHLGKSHFDN